MTARSIRRWALIHRWSSLACTLFLLLLCVTGLPLIFHDEIDAAGGRLARASSTPGSPPAPLDRVAWRAAQAMGTPVQVFYWKDEEPGVVHAVTGGGADLPMDMHAARPLSPPDRKGLDLMGAMLMLHSRLFMGLAGYALLGLAGLLTVLAVVSGVVLYGPFTRDLRFGEIRQGRSKRVAWLDLHNLTGIATAMWLGVVALTGVVNTLEDPLFLLWHAGAPPVATRSGPMIAIQQAFEHARTAAPGMVPNSMILPGSPLGSANAFIVWVHGDSPLTARLFQPVFVDAASGKAALDPGFPWYLRALNLARPLHFGDYGGWPLKILWALLDLVTIMVLCSGLYLWWGKQRRPPNPERQHRNTAPTLETAA
ncbi:PepSY-associated TM helix domain-containing protein [Novosphingobium terrae]|uniref:PepSY-associated TM helix domain-containing protein n=1 Tax=Novosphingobium terrae TaxID=2726189 RepID=UPI00197D4E53|nr:PepSY-associated TM helix domain-containing protein [Novosphingobium terrae]